MRRCLGAVCALALICACILPVGALSQSAGSGDNAADTKTAKKREKTAAAESKARASKPKAHPASHPPADKHPKSNDAVAAHNSKGKQAKPHKAGKKKTSARGQKKIEPERAQEIQEALIREHYLSGEASGTWNQSSEEAMRRYQADHGWQSKTVPDSRALISLGLGPSHDHLLNPESAMTTGPFPPRAAALTPASHSADPGARLNTTPPVAPAPASTPEHDPSSPQ